ncbi:MAG TPA: hypothetical protein VEU47_06435 [Candidatus Cybelea sp.]|nr:hypothetical protein [Candidatus Cybelea sp.]
MMRRVRLELARCHDFPDGSTKHGYELNIPLQANGKLDHDYWLAHRQGNTFRRFWGDEDEQSGELRHDGRGWMLSFGQHGDNEMIYKADAHRFAEGEYISIKERDGHTRTFRVVAVH